jgi:putative two-component system response regulator
MVCQRTAEVMESRLEIVQRLGRASEYRDNETGRHILRMSHSAAMLAKQIGWGKERCDLMLYASPMHDVGKIGISDSILLKPARLTDEERAIMETHTIIGADILGGSSSKLLETARVIALTHHEKWDGSGYPGKLAGTDIPIEGRIAAIVDVFDALTSVRPYKKAWSVDEAVEEMREQGGIHFDPELVEHFLAILPGVLRIKERFSEA